MKRLFIIGSFAVLVCALLFAASGWGQTGASTIRGTVKDPSGALVSSATVTLTNLETNAVRTAVTTTSGSFSFEFLPVGDYEVRVEAKGFRKLVVRPVQALVSNVTDVPAQLEIGEISSTVTVEAVAANVQVNTSDATLGNNFSRRLNSEAIEEFRVVTVNANADEGRSSAAQINLVTKSGTNS